MSGKPFTYNVETGVLTQVPRVYDAQLIAGSDAATFVVGRFQAVPSLSRLCINVLSKFADTLKAQTKKPLPKAFAKRVFEAAKVRVCAQPRRNAFSPPAENGP